MQLVISWFEVQPLLTVAFCALTPIPFVLARVVAVAARYSPARFLAGNALGRFPRFWAYGAVGVLLPVSTGALLAAGAVLTVILGVLLWSRRSRAVAGTAASLPD